jgi:hypothetical protein
MAMACNPCPLPSVVEFSTTLVRVILPISQRLQPHIRRMQFCAARSSPNGPPLWSPLLSGNAQAAAAVCIDSTCGPPPRARTWALESDALQLRISA